MPEGERTRAHDAGAHLDGPFARDTVRAWMTARQRLAMTATVVLVLAARAPLAATAIAKVPATRPFHA